LEHGQKKKNILLLAEPFFGNLSTIDIIHLSICTLSTFFRCCIDIFFGLGVWERWKNSQKHFFNNFRENQLFSSYYFNSNPLCWIFFDRSLKYAKIDKGVLEETNIPQRTFKKKFFFFFSCKPLSIFV